MQLDQLKRREFITLLGGAAVVWPLDARAQQADGMRRIGFLGGGTVSLQPIYNGLLQGMRELGYREGKDFVVEWRLAEGQYERFTEFAAEMVHLKVEVIVVSTPAGIRPTQHLYVCRSARRPRNARRRAPPSKTKHWAMRGLVQPLEGRVPFQRSARRASPIMVS